MYQVIVGACCVESRDFGEKLGIGIDLNGIPTMAWSFKSDIDHFKNTTTGNFVFMGRKTWESIPNRPLTNRINIVLSSKANTLNSTKTSLYDKPSGSFNLPGLTDGNKAYDYVHFVSSVEEGYEFYLKCLKMNKYQNKELFVMGGESLYQQMIEKYPQHLDKLFLTYVFTPYLCTNFFPMDLYLKEKHDIIFQTPKKTDHNILSIYRETIEYVIKVYKFNRK
jgi:dihydrofolate reductase